MRVPPRDRKRTGEGASLPTTAAGIVGVELEGCHMSDRTSRQSGGRGRGRERTANDRPPREPRDAQPGRKGGKPSGPPGGPGTGGKHAPGKPRRSGKNVPSGTKPPAGSGRGATGRGRTTRREEAPSLPVGQGNELLYGRNAVLEALRGPRDLRRLWLAEGLREDDRTRAVAAEAERRGIDVERVPRVMLDDAFSGANHQGVALEAQPYRYADLEDILDRPGTLLVLDHIQDPQNFGTLMRAAEAAGVAGVVIPSDRAVAVTPAVVNASAGAVEHLRIASVPNLPRALEAAKASGRWVLGLAGEDGATDLFTGALPTPAALVVGAEGSGLGQRVRSLCDLLVSLPMHGRVASLNAATAGSIALYELLRRDGPPKPGELG
jgi:23S rRNA (guanosine2251-2'-O)-methyltransferase